MWCDVLQPWWGRFRRGYRSADHVALFWSRRRRHANPSLSSLTRSGSFPPTRCVTVGCALVGSGVQFFTIIVLRFSPYYNALRMSLRFAVNFKICFSLGIYSTLSVLYLRHWSTSVSLKYLDSCSFAAFRVINRLGEHVMWMDLGLYEERVWQKCELYAFIKRSRGKNKHIKHIHQRLKAFERPPVLFVLYIIQSYE